MESASRQHSFADHLVIGDSANPCLGTLDRPKRKMESPGAIPCAPGSRMKRAYPRAKSVPVTDEYHGRRVPDPYRWLENTDSQETRDSVFSSHRYGSGT